MKKILSLFYISILLIVPVKILASVDNATSTVRDPFAESTLPLSFITANQDGTISINVSEIKVNEMLRALAQYGNKNIVFADAVAGNLTLHLNHVSWQQALNTILIIKGLTQKQQGNVLLVFPNHDIKNYETALPSELIPVHYAKAAELAGLLKGQENSLLSKSGYVSADPRTNAIWVQDTPQRLQIIHNFIKRLDVPVRQVLIKARIVSVDEGYLQELGIKFGTVNAKPTDLADGLNMDMPTAANTAGHFNIAVAKLGVNTLLDLELSALQSEGHGKIISSPELIAADRTAAYIESGEEVPYQERTTTGATSVAFKKAVLSLKVVPQVTNANNIILNLTVSEDKLSPIAVQGVPAIQKREVQTQVQVHNGQTLVLGGIYEQTDSNTTERIPFLASIPVAGILFRNKAVKAERKELLIFVTPEIQ